MNAVTPEEKDQIERIRLRMGGQRSLGKFIVTLHMSSPGHVQYVLPTVRALRKQSQNVELYIAQDFPMGSVLEPFAVRSEQIFPSPWAVQMEEMHVFLQPEIWGRGPVTAQRVFCGHGQPNKHTNWSEENLRAFNVYFLNGELEREMFEMIRASNPTATAHIVPMKIGYPKLDDLCSGAFHRETVLQSLGLDAGRKTVIYAPAWDPGGSLRTHGTGVVERLLSELPDVNVLAKLHPASFEPETSPNFEFYTGGVVWGPRFKSLEANPRFRYIDDYVINQYLAAADVMITDFSGVALEFMTQDKPALFIDSPEFYERTLRDWGHDPSVAKTDERFNAGRTAGTVVYDLADLSNEVKGALGNPNATAPQRRALMKRFLYNPGAAAEVAAEAILDLCRAPLLPN